MATPQYRALKTAHERGMANLGTWTQLVETLKSEWQGHFVKDMTRPYLLEPGYVLMIGTGEWPQAEAAFPEPRLIAIVSMLAPIFYIYESRTNPGEAQTNRDSVITRHDFSPDAAPIVASIERAIVKRFGYHRVDGKTGETIVPGIAVGHVTYGQVTVVDALLNNYWW